MATPRAHGAASGRVTRPTSSYRGRGRGARASGRHELQTRDEQSQLWPSDPSDRRGDRGKQQPSRGGGRARGRGGRGGGGSWTPTHRGDRSNNNRSTNRVSSSSGHRRQRASDSLLSLLPDDIVTQSLLPFFVWHDTSAMACVCRPWSIAVRHARQQHAQWTTRVFQGDNTHECMAKLSRALGRGASDGNVRFAPTFALVSLSFADLQSNARHTESVWSDLVDVVVARDVLPVGCVLVGILSGDAGRGRDVAATGDCEPPVSVTVSIGHLANTTVETAAFDRKALRWSASGLTEELECPFEAVSAGSESDMTQTSLLLWSQNAKPARTLLELASQWFPGAPIGGAVLSLGDHAPPLMTFTRTARTEPRRGKLQGRRKPKTTTESGGGILSCPSTLLLRLRGDVKVKPFSLCLDRPITPVLKNVEDARIATTDFDLMRQDFRSYGAVAVVGGEEDESATSQPASLSEVIRELTRFSQEELVGLKLYSSATPATLRAAFQARGVTATADADEVRPVPLYVGERGALTVSDHWPSGWCGVVTLPFNDDMVTTVAEAQMKKVLKTASGQGAFGGFVASNNLTKSTVEALFLDESRIQCHVCCADEGIGPLSLPSGITGSKLRLLVDTTTGFLLHR